MAGPGAPGASGPEVAASAPRGRGRPQVIARWTALVVAAAALCRPAAASADPASSNREAVLALYNEGKSLIEAGKIPEACRRFEEAKRLDVTAINLLLRLGDCYERVGRTASAYSQYKQAASFARAAGDARAEAAEERARAIEPGLARLTVRLAPGASYVEVRQNGALVTPEQLGKAVPVDPGAYTIEAVGADRERWSAQREVAPRAAVEVVLPRRGPRATPATPPRAATAPLAATAPAPSGPALSAFGAGVVALGVVGLAGLGVGTAFTLRAVADRDASNASGHCDAASACDEAGFSLRTKARAEGDGATLAFALGAAALAGGVALGVVGAVAAQAARGHGHAASRGRGAAATLFAGPGQLSVRGVF